MERGWKVYANENWGRAWMGKWLLARLGGNALYTKCLLKGWCRPSFPRLKLGDGDDWNHEPTYCIRGQAACFLETGPLWEGSHIHGCSGAISVLWVHASSLHWLRDMKRALILSVNYDGLKTTSQFFLSLPAWYLSFRFFLVDFYLSYSSSSVDHCKKLLDKHLVSKLQSIPVLLVHTTDVRTIYTYTHVYAHTGVEVDLQDFSETLCSCLSFCVAWCVETASSIRLIPDNPMKELPL